MTGMALDILKVYPNNVLFRWLGRECIEVLMTCNLIMAGIAGEIFWLFWVGREGFLIFWEKWKDKMETMNNGS